MLVRSKISTKTSTSMSFVSHCEGAVCSPSGGAGRGPGSKSQEADHRFWPASPFTRPATGSLASLELDPWTLASAFAGYQYYAAQIMPLGLPPDEGVLRVNQCRQAS